MARWAPGFLCRYCRNSAEGAPGGPQASSSYRSMPVRVSYGRATCAGHKQKYVRNELGIPSTQLGTQMHSLAWLGQVLCPAQHAISMPRGPPTTPTTAASRCRGRCSPGGSVERAVVATGRRQVAAFSGVNWYWSEKNLVDIFSTAWPREMARPAESSFGSTLRPRESVCSRSGTSCRK